jgi:hypothetical protein
VAGAKDGLLVGEEGEDGAAATTRGREEEGRTSMTNRKIEILKKTIV